MPSSGDSYTVEKVLDVKTLYGNGLAWVKWAGWDEKYNDWVAFDDLGAQWKLKAEQMLKSKPSGRQRSTPAADSINEA